MKRTNLFTIAILSLSLFFLSCKKDKESTTEKLQHTWTIQSTVENTHDSSGDDIVTTPGTSGDFITFNSDGTVTSHLDGTDDSGQYVVLNDNEVTIEGETFTIKTLTSNTLVLYVKLSSSDTDYDEITINAKR